MNLIGKTIVITGGGSGMGEACAHLFSKNGAKVVVADRDEVRGKSVAAAITAKGDAAAFIATDVTNEISIKGMVDFAVMKFGGLDGAVNGAGIAGNPARIVDLDATEWRRHYDVMTLGVALCMKYEIPEILKRGGGSIINIASKGGLDGVAMQGPYVAAKHGAVGVTKCAALECATLGVRVNAICPGLIDTPMFRNMAVEGADYSSVLKTVPMRRFGEASEIADAALWLLSGSSSFVTGQAICVDGGMFYGGPID